MNLKEYIQSEIKSQLGESVKEGVEPQIKKIAHFTGTRPEAVEDFVSKHALNITKLLKYVQKGGLPQRMELVSALAGRDGNSTQKKIIKMFSESVVTEAKKKLPKFKNIPSWANYVAQHSDGEWTWYEETPTMIKFKDGSGGAWKQDGNQTYTGVKTDGKDWDKIPTYYNVKNGKITESVNEAKVNYDFSEDELKRVLKLLGRNASTEVKMIKAFEKAFGRKLTRDELFESVNEAITDGDVVIFKKQKGEVPKITYNSSRKQFAADFLSHTDYYKNLTDAIEDMQDAGFKIEKHIQTESVNEGKQYKKGDKLKIKLKNGKEFDLTFDSYGRQKGMAFGKFDGDIKPFSLDTIKEEQLDEKLITFSNRAPYGQIVFMAGGAGSGKGFAIDNFIDAAGFKVRDVDEMKKALGKLDQLGKVSVDKWFKKYGNKLSTKPPKNNPKGMTEREHIEEFVLGKNLSISDIASDLKNPNNVASLHYIVDTMGLKDKWLINMLKGKSNKETLPNLLFDITAKKVASITDVIKPLIEAGYNSKNVHLIWVLTNYYTAVEANKDRDRVVPDDILLQTHEGAAKTMWEVLTQIKPKGLEGRIDVILNNRDQTAFFVDDKGEKIKVEPSQQNKLKEAEPIVKGFKSLPIKKQGGGIFPENVWKNILKDWILKNVPKTISLTQDVMKTSKDK